MMFAAVVLLAVRDTPCNQLPSLDHFATLPSPFTRSNLLFFEVFSSTTLLTYILFWMIFYNLAHIF